MPDCEVAFLCYEPLKQRRADNSFDGNDNIGAYVVIDCLRRAGIDVGFCSPETAAKYKVILVSFTSTYDLISFYQEVALLPSWQRARRSFSVIAGGFGMQNPCSVRNFVDYAVFGRAEIFVADLVGSILGGGKFEHRSVMCLPELHPVTVSQVEQCILTRSPSGIEHGSSHSPVARASAGSATIHGRASRRLRQKETTCRTD